MLVSVDLSNLPKISDERLREILAFDHENEDMSDCPELTDEQLAQMRPGRHRPQIENSKSTDKVQELKLAG